VTSQTSGALLVAVLARRRDRDNWAACFDPSTVPVGNPWHLAYVACQGLVLHQGLLVEQGTHHELLAAGGRYANLYNIQATAYSHHSNT